MADDTLTDLPAEVVAKRQLALQKLAAARLAKAARTDTAARLVTATHDDQQSAADQAVADQQAKDTASDYLAAEAAFFAAG